MSGVGLNVIQHHRSMREAEDQKRKTHRRQLLVLVYYYLKEQGYLATLDCLKNEASLNLDQFSVCDNLDLDIIFQEYLNYYMVRFQRLPQIMKKISHDDKESPCAKPKKATNLSKPSKVSQETLKKSQDPPEETEPKLEIKVKGFNYKNLTAKEQEPDLGDCSSKLLQPLGAFPNYTAEWKELAQVISKDIYLENPNVRWNDILGLDKVKHLLKEAVVFPTQYPDLFSGILAPWKGILLYGPPGTGKTMLAKAVATECHTTFFNISASTIVSKWRGDSEKLVRVLFELARFHAPSTIFMDELDSLMSQRCTHGGPGEHEASRRMKTEILIQMDGLARSDELIFFLAASNTPWDLDLAILRRLEKRILVPLPDENVRRAMVNHFLPRNVFENSGRSLVTLETQIDAKLVAEATNGYSGADIRLVCKEAAMNSVRKVFDALENNSGGNLDFIELEPISSEAVLAAVKRTKPSGMDFKEKYIQWQKQYESI